jgi:hypothetical protein
MNYRENACKCLTTAIFAILIFLMIGCNPRALPFIKDKLKANDEINTKNTEEAIKTDEKLRELNDLCKSITLPDSFKFYSKNRSQKNSDLISFYYYSNANFDDFDKTFRQHFLADDWQLFENDSVNRITEFRKNDKIIAAQYGGIGLDANYAFICKRIIEKKD